MSLFYLFSPAQPDVSRDQMYDVNPYQVQIDFESINHGRPTVFDIEGDPKGNSETSQELDEKEGETVVDQEGEPPIQQLEDLFNQPEEFLNRILDYEKMFSQNSYQGDMEGKDPFKFKKGNNPILISAPHSTEKYREGSIKSADIYTGSIALLLQHFTDSYVIYTTRIGEDPNYIENGKYKERIKRIVEEHNIQYVLDLHGAANSHPFDVDLGTAGGVSLADSEVALIQNEFQSNDIHTVTENHTFAARTSGTITNYTYHQLGVPAVQLEINKKYRNPREDLSSYYKMVHTLVKIVNQLNE